jgi:hypothetical protein
MKQTFFIVLSVALLGALFPGCQDPMKIEGDLTANPTSGPENLKAQQGKGYVLLTWNPTLDNRYYEVLRRELDSDKPAVRLGSAWDSTNSVAHAYYLDRAGLSNGLEDGKKYEYSVRISKGGPAAFSRVTTPEAVEVPGPGAELPFPTVDVDQITVNYITGTRGSTTPDYAVVRLPVNPLYRYNVMVEQLPAGQSDWRTAIVIGFYDIDDDDAYDSYTDVVGFVDNGDVGWGVVTGVVDYTYDGYAQVGISLDRNGGYTDGTQTRVALYYYGLSLGVGYKVPYRQATATDPANFITAKNK